MSKLPHESYISRYYPCIISLLPASANWSQLIIFLRKIRIKNTSVRSQCSPPLNWKSTDPFLVTSTTTRTFRTILVQCVVAFTFPTASSKTASSLATVVIPSMKFAPLWIHATSSPFLCHVFQSPWISKSCPSPLPKGACRHVCFLKIFKCLIVSSKGMILRSKNCSKLAMTW